MSDSESAVPGADFFTRFWTDAMARTAGAAMSPSGSSPDVADQMRKSFFDALTRSADEFMRSEQFLSAMKQNMDNSLAFRKQLNQFLIQGLQAAQMPTSADSDHMVLLLRGMEERVLAKLDDLSERVEKLESRSRNGAAAKTETKTAAAARRKT